MKDDGGLSILVGIDRALKVDAGACIKLCIGVQRRSGVTRYGNIGAYLVLYNGETDFSSHGIGLERLERHART